MRAVAPGRVNLIGDHTDYVGGLALPMAIDRATTIECDRGGDAVELVSDGWPEPAVVPLEQPLAATVPTWGRYIAGVVHELRPDVGLVGRISSTLPPGSGLSSSAALEVAAALALGATGTPLQIAELCQRAEQVATGVPCGLMDQLASVAGQEGHALLVDFRTLTTQEIRVPADADVVVVNSGRHRQLATSAYAERRRQCEGAAELIGPLRDASLASCGDIADDVLRRRARHVVSENARVLRTADALERGALDEAGRLMTESHASLRDDFDVSTPALDEIVARLLGTPGVYGARLTGAGFGGCVVALTRPGAVEEGWVVRAATGARLFR